MKEDFLHYVWLYKKLNVNHLKTIKGENLQILHFGHYLQTAGPDFFNAQIILGNQKWAGNIEIHVKSSDWYLHHHEKDEKYDNVILHVVWEYDMEVYRKDNSEIPILELKQYVNSNDYLNYTYLSKKKSWINCENQITSIDSFIFNNWMERLFFERVETKSKLIYNLLEETKNDWDSVLFCLLAKNFGLNTNGDVFLKMAKIIPFSVIRKEKENEENLEALFYGITNLLEQDNEDSYFQILKKKWFFLKEKYQLKNNVFEDLQFYKLRPDNFPTIRLSQLAALYHSIPNLFEYCISIKDCDSFYNMFNVVAGVYWDYHYNFDKRSSIRKKRLTKEFIDLLIINTIIPIQFTYSNYLGKDNSEAILALLRQLKSEKNKIINQFEYFGVISESALESQSLLHLKKNYCDNNKCLECTIGINLIKN
ncbi:conserved hypothetical protein [Flavobacterium sp. 9AF]|uniref:DUF2851 family protein n=1 Tax=Flavobacterium sp. 9AF TaxID=2653142 RepID=UPI0012F05E30|nr:DUF2851 family protein [Flavobacterium sp. 9AF]VXB94038.1 conserved hypothetical protein [Flavobacterium sp. 9AF]